MSAEEVNSVDIPKAKQEEIVVTDYMKHCFAKIAVEHGFENYKFSVNYGSSIGDGFVGNMLKISIEENGSAKCLDVLVKIPLANKVRRETMKMMSLFEREIFVYNVMLPTFMDMQNRMQVPETLRFNNFPKVYFAEINKEIDEALIIMEDLRDSGHKMWNKSIPINFAHAKLLVTALGRLHGLSFVMRSKSPEKFKAVQNFNDDFSDVLQTPQFEVLLKGAVMRIIDVLGQEDADLKEKVMGLVENLNEIVIEKVKPKYVEPYAVMLHGDCWINNFLFHYTENATPHDIKLIDWQITRYGSPAIDLIYFFFICTDQALRANHFDELMGIYYNSLKHLVEAFECNPNDLFSFETLKQHMKTFGKFGVIMSAFILPALLAKDEQILDLDYVIENTKKVEGMSGRVADKMVEADSFAKRIRGVLVDAIKYGYL